MVLAYHLILTAYGFWLPNDPRGSWSTWVRRWEILGHGAATKVETRRSVAATPHDHVKRIEAKRSLMFPPVTFNGTQARAVARGFARAVAESEYVVFACAVLRNHAHLVVRMHARRVEQMASHFKGRATQQLAAEGIHPLVDFKTAKGATPSPWGVGFWKVFIHDERHLCAAVRYVEHNPVREGLKPQSWRFVTALR
jgi:REP element-mobilizing transposase RayT